jgi:hypothetical protein
MKTSVYYTGITCSILMLIGCMFKVMHWPGANILLMLSVFTFCFGFLPIALMNSYKAQISSKYKTLHVVAYLVFAFCMMGVLFKVMHWPGASIFLLIGLPLPFVLFLPVYLNATKDEKKEGNKNFLGMMFGLTFLAIFSVLLALTVSKQVLASAIIKVVGKENSASFSSNIANGINANEAIKKSSDELCLFIEDLKCQLLVATGNEHLCSNNKMMTGPELWSMSQLDVKVYPNIILDEKLEELRSKIGVFHNTLKQNGKMSPELTALCQDLFSVESAQDPLLLAMSNTVLLSWEQREFGNKQLIFMLDGLTEIQSNVRLVESEILLESK